MAKKTLSEAYFNALHAKISKADCTKPWVIIIEHKDFIDKIVLDNDVTYVEFNCDGNEDGASYVSTKSYLGKPKL